MRNRTPTITARHVIAGLLAVATFACVPQNTLAAEPPVDPATHAKHVAAGAMPPDAAKGDPALSQQLYELQAKVARLEAALANNAPPPAAVGAMPGMGAPAAPMAAAPMAGMKSPAPGAMKRTGGMGGMAAPPEPKHDKMAVMQQMMGMMDKMMSMNDGPMPATAPMAGGGMGMMDDKMEMGGMGGGAMPAGAPAAGMSGSGGGMGMDKMEMAAMMGMGAMPGGAAGTMPQSVLPGYPGASHLYHIGATDFFLDHPQHIALTTEQQAALNKAKEQAMLAKSSADRAVAQANQELWTLTAADQPDAAKIEAKISEIEKLTGDERLGFIRAVGDASKLLTDQQRKILTGFAPPAPAMSAPAAPAMAAPMKDM